MLITKPEFQQVIEKIVALFKWKLRCASLTNGGATSPTALRQFLTRSLPHDDNWKEIPIVILRAEKCKPGDEGATVEIKPLP